MVEVLPFRALRPPRSLACAIASLPYDVISREEARQSASNNPMSFFHISRSEIDLPLEIPDHDPRVYEKARENFENFLSNGWLVRDENASFYLYRLIRENHSQIGLVAATSVSEYDDRVIKKHELTRPDKEDDRTRHISVIGAHDEPVFLTFRAEQSINLIFEEISESPSVCDFVADDGIRHTLWVVPEGKNQVVAQAFHKVPCLYIADGHHRSAAASRLRQDQHRFNDSTGAAHFLSVLFPHDQVMIVDYNRVVRDLRGMTIREFLKALDEKFEVEKTDQKQPREPHHFGMYLDGTWYRLKAKAGSYAETPTKSLDVSILQDNLLAPILGIENPRTDKRINFIGGSRGMTELERLVNSHSYEVAFSMFPTTVEQLMSVADAGEIMPPKSTWFEPKLRSGLVIHPLTSG